MYLGDKFRTPDDPREWGAFVTRTPRVSTSMIPEGGSQPYPRDQAQVRTRVNTDNVKPADNSATLKRPNKPISTPMCYDGKLLDVSSSSTVIQ